MATYAIITTRRQLSLNVPRVLVDRIDRALALGLTGAYSRDEFARSCIEARLEALERLDLDAALVGKLTATKPGADAWPVIRGRGRPSGGQAE
jgi:hypothetical protein